MNYRMFQLSSAIRQYPERLTLGLQNDQDNINWARKTTAAALQTCRDERMYWSFEAVTYKGKAKGKQGYVTVRVIVPDIDSCAAVMYEPKQAAIVADKLDRMLKAWNNGEDIETILNA